MITVYIPALNEESHLRLSITTIISAAEAIPLDIIIVNDGSTDGTQEVINQLKKEFPYIRSVHHPKNKGIGCGFLEALKMAKYNKIIFFPADNCPKATLIRKLFQNADKADFVVSYIINTECRGRFRSCLSSLFSFIYMLTFNVHIKYINGSAIYRRDLLTALNLRAERYSIIAEIGVKLLRSGVTFCEISGEVNPPIAQKNSALGFRNFVEVIGTYLRLLYEVFIKDRSRFSASPTRV